MFVKFKNYKPFLLHPLGAVLYLAFWVDLGYYFYLKNFFTRYFFVFDEKWRKIDFAFIILANPKIVAFAALFVLFCEVFLKEEISFKKALFRPINLIILIVVFVLSYFVNDLTIEGIETKQYALYYFGIILPLFFGICAFKIRDFKEFEGFVCGFLFSLILGFLITFLFALLGTSFYYLFYYEIRGEAYFLACLFAGFIFLHLLGDLDFKFKGFILKIFNIFALFYLLLLLIYVFALPFGLEPKSTVHLCLWFGIFLLILYWINLASNSLSKRVRLMYFFIVFILACCAFYGIFVRIDAYGFTLNRLIALFLSIWLMSAVLLSVFWVNKTLKLSFIFLAIIALIVCFFGAKITLTSQKAQLETLKSKETFSKEEAERFVNIQEEIDELTKKQTD